MTFDRQRFVDDLTRLALMDIPWLHQGDDPMVGCDCVGIIKHAAELQIVLPEELAEAFTAYHRPPNGRRMMATMRRFLTEIEPETRKPGDLIVFYIRKNPCHLAVEMHNGQIAEALEAPGVSRFMIRPIPSDRPIAACFRVPDAI